MPRNSLLPESGMRLPVKEILRACMLGSVVVGGATLGREPLREPPAPMNWRGIGMMKKFERRGVSRGLAEATRKAYMLNDHEIGLPVAWIITS